MVYPPKRYHALLIRNSLNAIMKNYKRQSITVIIRNNTATISAYGEPTKTDIEITTDAVLSPISSIKDWMPDGVLPDSDLECIITSLSNGGTNYLTTEFFNQSNPINIWVKIGTLYYRVMMLQGHEDMLADIPYLDMVLRKLEAAP